MEFFFFISVKLDIHTSIFVYPKLQQMAQSVPLACKTKSCSLIFDNNLYYNYSCTGFHELNMSCV